MNLTRQTIKRLNNGTASPSDEDNLYLALLQIWGNTVIQTGVRVENDICSKKKTEEYDSSHLDPDDIDPATYDAMYEEICKRCDDLRIDCTELSNDLVRILLNLLDFILETYNRFRTFQPLERLKHD